jgi:hypothetical protein
MEDIEAPVGENQFFAGVPQALAFPPQRFR